MQIRAYSDYHVHVRDGQPLKDVVPYTTAHCGRFMVMPNRDPHVIYASQMVDYREMIKREIKHPSEVLMTISLTEEVTPGMIRLAAEEGCTAVKLYPEGVTEDGRTAAKLHPGKVKKVGQCGIRRDVLWSLIETGEKDITPLVGRFWENLKAIEDSGMVLCIHGEIPGEEVLNREKTMFPLIRSIFYNFKKIRVVLEHITTCEAVDLINGLDYSYPGRIAATITPHHLMYTLTDLLGDKLRPHLFCKPVLKNRIDKNALLGAAISRRKCFFLGSDSAPWYRFLKECASGCAGVWNSPVLVSAMFKIFEGLNSLPLLEDFTSTFGDLFYHKESVDRYLNVEKSEWVVESEIHGIVPFLAGQTMQWRVMDQ